MHQPVFLPVGTKIICSVMSNQVAVTSAPSFLFDSSSLDIA
jgi:hypothetical protein